MLNGKHLEFYESVSKLIPKDRLHHDALTTLAFGTDASFYRLIPKLVVVVKNEDEIIAVNKLAYSMNIGLTYRAAGTSLSGQSISDSVLVIATHGWTKHEILEGGSRIKLQPGIKGFQANAFLSKYGKKIGPDPASIDSAMIGGIVANNASGMCCGTSENSYKTISDIRIVLADGAILDTSNTSSVEKFKESHKDLITKLEELSNRVKSNRNLYDRIVKKFKIKNTTGYSLNALTDFSDGIEILKHLIVGSEGTLAFISDITYNTVIEQPFKALSLIIFPTIKDACDAVLKLKSEAVSAVEIMDRANIRSVEDSKGVPEFLKSITESACALLVETRAESEEELEQNCKRVIDSINSIPKELPFTFTTDKKEQYLLWKIRKESFPTIAGMRESGKTPIIEDICFPITELAEATLKLQSLFDKHGYKDAVIFGHALEGNLHFVFNQNFSNEEEIKRYADFMEDVTNLVVDQYDGSLKAEHGTGRNMAPFVEKEWGKDAYELMLEIKNILDPKSILNPGVILNSDTNIHLKNLKPMHSIKESADKCMECGFCEGVCVSEGFTLSPRQRVTSYREIQRLRKSGEEPHRAAELNKHFKYYGLDSCATDSLCYVKCPVGVDTGKLIKELRAESHNGFQNRVAKSIASNMGLVTLVIKHSLNLIYTFRSIFGYKFFKLFPQWKESIPKGVSDTKNKIVESLSTVKPKVVYFPSCITRTMGKSRDYCGDEVELTQLTKILLERAGYEIIYPDKMDSLCCGMAFSSKGFTEAGRVASDKLEKALLKASENNKYPVLCDMSPCLYTMKSNFGNKVELFEPAEFSTKFLLDKLNIKQIDKGVSIFPVCSAKKMGVDEHLIEIAKRCATKVVVNESNCCGFAGDRGFILPELNKHGLRYIKSQVKGVSSGYSTSRTCEIGLTEHSGISYKSIFYLIEEASR